MSRSRMALASAALIAAALLTGGSPAAAATDVAAVTCYGGAVNWTYSGSGTKELGPYRASSRCRDVNLRTTSGVVVACVVFIDHTTSCNTHPEPDVFGTAWGEVATDVIDGTRFVVRILPWSGNTARSGKVAF